MQPYLLDMTDLAPIMEEECEGLSNEQVHLRAACMDGYAHSVYHLIAHCNADAFLPDDYDGKSPFLLAVEHGHIDVIINIIILDREKALCGHNRGKRGKGSKMTEHEGLRSYSFSYLATHCNRDGFTGMMIALQRRHYDIMMLLSYIEPNAIFNINKHGDDIFTAARARSMLDVMDTLQQHYHQLCPTKAHFDSEGEIIHEWRDYDESVDKSANSHHHERGNSSVMHSTSPLNDQILWLQLMNDYCGPIGGYAKTVIQITQKQASAITYRMCVSSVVVAFLFSLVFISDADIGLRRCTLPLFLLYVTLLSAQVSIWILMILAFDSNPGTIPHRRKSKGPQARADDTSADLLDTQSIDHPNEGHGSIDGDGDGYDGGGSESGLCREYEGCLEEVVAWARRGANVSSKSFCCHMCRIRRPLRAGHSKHLHRYAPNKLS